MKNIQGEFKNNDNALLWYQYAITTKYNNAEEEFETSLCQTSSEQNKIPLRNRQRKLLSKKVEMNRWW